ncbi:MAG: hypothetical protein SGILL_006169 [Bacillariaceae sp.]
MCPRLVIAKLQVYRIITSSLLHANLMHIGMNMMSMAAIGGILEKKSGTLRLLFSIGWAILLTGGVYISVAYLVYAILGYDQLVNSHAVGFSGVLFHLLVMETYLQAGESRSLFGFVSVPPALYPWVLLVVLQFIMPNISFMGHLSGIITGNSQYYGLLDKFFCFMGDTFLTDLESRVVLRNLTNLPGFVPTSQGTSGQYSGDGGDVHNSVRFVSRTIRKAIATIRKVLRDILETILVCIFGTGSRLNGNIRFWERPGRGNVTDTSNSLALSTLEANEGDTEEDENTSWHEHAAIETQERENLVSRIV